MKLLVIEDERRMADLLRQGLQEEGHTVVCAYDGAEGLEIARAYQFDVILLDIMMPKVSGHEIVRRLRAQKNETPILFLTALDAVSNVVQGLDLGADDYLTKPFAFDELLARLRAVMRRANLPLEPRLQVADLTLDPASHEVTRAGVRLNLTRTEYSILERLMFRAGKVVPRNVLIETVWGFDREIEDNTLDAFLRLLRNKIDGPGQAKLIHTVRGVGYCVREGGEA